MASVRRMKLGSQGLEVSAQGLGCMGMSSAYGPPKPEPDMISLIHHAHQTGITFFDTADLYGPFTNELLLGKVWVLLISALLSPLLSSGFHFFDQFFFFHLGVFLLVPTSND